MIDYLKKKASYHKRWLTVMLIAALIVGFMMYLIVSSFLRWEQLGLQSRLDRLRSEVEVALQTYENFSRYIFDHSVNNSEVLTMISEASQADLEKQAEIREQLYSLLIEDYNMITAYKFRQLHFHFADGTSFLRFHKPDLYGDPLFNVRDSVRIANQQQRYVFGFEEGRIYNGYRFVYPLNWQGRHIGSVEVSISMDSLIELLNQLYPERDLYFMLDAEIVRDAVFEEQQSNYIASPFSEKYLFDVEVGSDADSNLQNVPLSEDLLVDIKSNSEAGLVSRGDFSFYIQRDNKQDVEVQYLAIKNIVDSPVGYFISLSDDSTIAVSRMVLIRELLMLGAIFIIFALLSFFYNRERLRLHKLSYSDALTGIYNRYMFLRYAEKEFERHKRYKSVFSIALMDIDHFKVINDTYGHNEGDEVLRIMTNAIKCNLRKSDVFARWGGEEFILLMPETNLSGAKIAAEKVRELVSCQNYGIVGKVTVSVGVAVAGNDETLEHLVARADEKLYLAKENGRNRTEI